MVGQMNSEQMEAVIKGLDETETARQGVDGADATVSEAVTAITDLIVDIAGGEHGFGAAVQVRGIEATFEAALAAVQLLVYLGIHSKSLRGRVVGQQHYSIYPAKTPKDFEFFRFLPRRVAADSLA
jgi:hypothetical protein